MGSACLDVEAYAPSLTPASNPGESAVQVRRFIVAWGLTVVFWLACEAAALAGFAPEGPAALASAWAVVNPWFVMSVGAGVLFFLCCKPSRAELIGLLVLGSLAFFGLRRGGLPTSNATSLGFGTAGMVLMLWRCLVGPAEKRTETLALLLPAVLVPVYCLLNHYCCCASIWLCPKAYDATLYAADATLGFQPSFAVGRLFQAVPLLALVAAVVYNTLPLGFLAIFLLQTRAGRLPNGSILWPSAGAAVFGFLLYLTFPVVGPIFTFTTDFPYLPPSAEAVLLNPPPIADVPRNCMPSLHTAWGLLVWWHSRALARHIRIAAAGFLALTLLATLGFGLHYAFDLVVAFPFTLAVQAAFTPTINRRRQLGAILFGAAATAGWLTLVAFGRPLLAVSPLLTGMAALLTVAASWRMERSLVRDPGLAPWIPPAPPSEVLDPQGGIVPVPA